MLCVFLKMAASPPVLSPVPALPPPSPNTQTSTSASVSRLSGKHKDFWVIQPKASAFHIAKNHRETVNTHNLDPRASTHTHHLVTTARKHQPRVLPPLLPGHHPPAAPLAVTAGRLTAADVCSCRRSCSAPG